MKAMLAAFAVALLVTGCGGGGGSSTPTKTYVESATCRHQLASFLDAAQEITKTGVSEDAFHQREDALEHGAGRALKGCSPVVQAPVKHGVDHLKNAGFLMVACSFAGDICPVEAKIQRQILAAKASFDEARRLMSQRQ